MITVYAMRSPNVFKVVIMLEEIGLPYALKHVRLDQGEHLTPEMLALNPNGKIPVIIDTDGPGHESITIFETGAILIYLAEKAGRLLGENDRARYELLQWLMVQISGVGPMFGQHVHFVNYAPQEGNEYSRKRYRSQVIRLLETIDKRLGETAYVGGPDYSIVDIAMFPYLRSIRTYGIEFDRFPKLQTWFDAISERPAVIRANEAMADIISADAASFPKMDKDALDRIVNRGRYAKA